MATSFTGPLVLKASRHAPLPRLPQPMKPIRISAVEDIAAGGKARFSFDADIDGVFEIELEDSGVQLAELRVKP